MARYDVKIDRFGVPSLNGRRGRPVGQGLSRQAYRIGRYVVKVSTEQSGQNKVEFDVYQRIPKSKRKHFATVFRYGKSNGFSFIIQSYVERGQYMRTAKRWCTVNGLAREIGLLDIRENNWYIDKNGTVKIFDLGIALHRHPEP